ncbi:hypothetical protein TRAPUB_2198, partial [Trametes pubescens]
RPGQENAIEVQRTKENTMYQFYKLNVATQKELYTTEDGVNAVMSNAISFHPSGKPVPSSLQIDPQTPTETREWEKCNTILGSTSFRLPHQSERQMIQMFNRQQAPPKAVNV